MTLSELADKMKGIDIAVLTTLTEEGQLAGRPMSNNGDVAYDGDSFYFTDESTHTVSDIERNANVGLAFQGSAKLFQGVQFYVFVEGKASLNRERAAFEAHWTKDLDRWFEDGIDTQGLVLIKVSALRIKYWNGTKSGDVTL